MTKSYDVVIIGAGSVGVPAALAMSNMGLKVAIIDEQPSPGQGQNKKAIGGIRATHTSPAKIKIALRSIEIFSSWKEKYGQDIEWQQGGYTFVAYTEEHEELLKNNIAIQQAAGLNIDWVDSSKIEELVPGIVTDGLRGGTYSSGDGNASPLKSILAFYEQSKVNGAEYYFKEKVTDIKVEQDHVKSVLTDKEQYDAQWVINAAGKNAREIAKIAGIDVPVYPDSHEAGISEPVKKFIEPLVVDLRPGPGTKNFYFYQNVHGQFVLCLTPEPLIPGTDERETSVFLPQVANRLTKLIPRTKHLRMRRTWRGLYPMSPDGLPIVGETKEVKGFVNAVGMCGQGFMLGPGLGELLGRIVTEKLTEKDNEILNELSLYRNFAKIEKLK